jgi:hypothetical protein
LEDIEMSKYRKKPVVIDAVQWKGVGFSDEFPEWFVGAFISDLLVPDGKELIIQTLEDGIGWRAKHVASLDDWIIRGIKGELYACKPDIFEATYEAVE